MSLNESEIWARNHSGLWYSKKRVLVWLLSQRMLSLLGGSCRPCCLSFNVHMWNQDYKSALNWQFDFWVDTPPKKVWSMGILITQDVFIIFLIWKKTFCFWNFGHYELFQIVTELLIDRKLLKCSVRREIKSVWNINVRKMLWIFFI